MIPLDKLRAVKTLITHGYPDGPCPDGLASAMIVREVLPDVEVLFLSHDDPRYAYLEARPGLLFCDLSPPAARVQEFVDAGTIVLDHHKTARSVVEAFGPLGVFGDEVSDPGVSGAVLAFREVYLPIFQAVELETRDVDTGLTPEEVAASVADFMEDAEHVERFARLAGIRDTWQKDSPDWQEACAQAAVLTFYPVSDWLSHWDPCSWVRMNRRSEVGPVLLAKRTGRAEAALENAYRFTTDRGTRVCVIATGETSDAAEIAGDACDVLVGFSFSAKDQKQQMKLSLRSKGTYDVSAFAKRLGGGGHTKAAGCAIPIDSLVFDRPEGAVGEPIPIMQPYDLVRYLLGIHEAGEQRWGPMDPEQAEGRIFRSKVVG